MLAESLRPCDLSRKIEGDSVRRVIDQVLGSYLLSCMAFSVYEVVRVTSLSQSWFIYFLLRRKQSKYAIDKLRERLPQSKYKGMQERDLCA